MMNIVTLIVITLGFVFLIALLSLVLIKMKSLDETSGKVELIRKTVDDKMSNLDQTVGEMRNLSQMLQNETRRVTDYFERLMSSSGKAGQFGEFILEIVLKELIPAGYLDRQREIRGRGRVDYLVKLGDKWVPIDAKFPISALNNSKGSLSSILKRRIDEVAKYIAPDQDTTDFALMFIPSNSLFSMVADDPDIFEHAKSKRVFLTSPSTIYAFLQILAMVIRMKEIAPKVEQIIESLRAIEMEIQRAFDHLDKAEKQIHNVTFNFSQTRSALNELQKKLNELR